MMSRTAKQILACALLFPLLFCNALSAVKIKEINVRGNRYVSEAKIRRVLQIDEGDMYEELKFMESLKRLFATKDFKDIQAYREMVDGEIVLDIVVEEYARVDAIEFKGNDHVNKDDITKVISMKEGGFMRPALLSRDADAISELYKEKGYYRISVDDTLEVKDKKQVLVYKINEGNKVSIKHIDFFGNLTLDSDVIRGSMESKEDRWWRGGEFKPKVLEEDDERILTKYREFGFLDVKVKDKELIFSENGKDLDIFITVEEGKQYKLGALAWHGNTIIKDREIEPFITMDKGMLFNDSEFTNMQLAISSLYWDRGYIYNSVTPIKAVRGDMVDVDLEIVEGKPAHVREINIAGNTKTAENVIRRELVISPGEVFLRPRLIRSLREVFNLGFFAGPPEVSTAPANEEGDIDITLKVQEKQTGQFRLGAGFSALNKISGFFGISEPNFLGRGWRIGIDWEFSKYRQNVDLRFTDPWFMGTPTEVSVNLYNTIQNQVSQQFYDDRRRGFSLRVGRPFPWFDYTSIYVRYRYESVELLNFSPGYFGPLRNYDWPQRTSSIGTTISRNSTDSPFHPTTGTSSYITAEWNGGKFLGGDTQFQKYQAGFSWYSPLFWKFVLEVSMEAAILDGYRSPSQVPDYELFRLGGNRRYGLRGYDFFEVVPDGNQEFIGGRYYQILSYEVTFPIAQTVYGLFFLDNGNTWNSFRGADVFDLKKGVGLGLRIEVPMLGTVGLDYGYGFDKVGGPGWEPHISLGGMF